jgi:hypothetical protein
LPERVSPFRGVRLRLKPTRKVQGSVQGAWWPRAIRLTTELPPLLRALSVRLGRIDRVIYNQNQWGPAPLSLEFDNKYVILEGSDGQEINTLSVIGQDFGTLVLLVVPPFTDPSRAYTIVMTAAKPDNASTSDELLGISAQAAEDRRLAVIAHQRWESDGGALHPEYQPVASTASREVRSAD